MEDLEDLPLSKNTKILFNLLEIRIFDLSQVLQVAGKSLGIQGHKFSINQAKETLQKQYNIFGQIQKIFDELKMNKLYDLMKQVSQNYISIASILIDEKTCSHKGPKYTNLSEEKEGHMKIPVTQSNDSLVKASPRRSKKKGSIIKAKQQEVSETQLKQCIQSISRNSDLKQKQKLGGVHLFNQNYVRGIQSLQNKWQAIEKKKKKHFNQKQLIKQLIFKEMSEEVEVEKLHENDQISKFIKEGKIKHELYSHIEYEKDLQSISVFLKQSQDDALKFLTDSKKVKEQENQDDIIINYHELIQILAEKKKSQFEIIQSKIKEIVDSFKLKVDWLENLLHLKESNIKELTYKLKRKESIEVASQTAGLRSQLNTHSAFSPQDMEEQHKAIIDLLKNNIQNNQKELMSLQTDVRVKDQKIKKRQTQIYMLQTEVEKYKRNLKEEKEKTLQLVREKASFNFYNQSQYSEKLQEINNQKIDADPANASDLPEDNFNLQTNRRRKNKYSLNHSNSIMSSPHKAKRYDSVMSSAGFGSRTQNDNRRVNTLIEGMQGGMGREYDTQSGMIYSVETRGHESIGMISSGRQQFTGTRNTSCMLPNQSQEIMGDRNGMGTKLKSMVRLGGQTSSDVQNVPSLSRYITPTEAESHQHNNTKFHPSIPRKPTGQKSSSFFFDNTLSSPRDSETLFSTQILLKKNTETLYDVLFGSVEPVDGQNLVLEEEIQTLKQFLSKYNQRQVQSKLRRTLSFFNLNENSDCEQIVEKQVCEEDDSVENSQRFRAENNFSRKTSKFRQNFEIQGFKEGKRRFDEGYRGSNFSRKTNRIGESVEIQESTQDMKKVNEGFRSKQIRSETLKPIELEKLKEKKIFPHKQIPAAFLKKLHEMIRIKGKGFNLSKHEFIEMCKTINVEETYRSSQNASDTESEEQSSSQNPRKPGLLEKYKNKDYIIFESIQDHQNQDMKLKVEGLALQEKLRKERRKSTYFKKQNQALENNEKLSKLSKSNKFSITKEIEHVIGYIEPIKNHESPTKSSSSERKKVLKEFFRILKIQGARIESLQKLQEIVQLNHLTLEDILRITNLLKSQKVEDFMSLFSHNCEHTSKLKGSNSSQNSSQPCCLHAKRYETFLQKLSITQNSVKKNRKDLLSIHIFNIDGKESQKDFSKKILAKQKSAKLLDMTNLSQSRANLNHERTAQFESFYGIMKKNLQNKQKKINQKHLTKKPAVSSYVDAKPQKSLEVDRREECERKTVGNPLFKSTLTGFLPQLATKGMSQLLRD